MTEAKRKEKFKLPDVRSPYETNERESRSKEKDLTDPPVLKKGNGKPISDKPPLKQNELITNLLDMFEKSHAQFTSFSRQVIEMQQRQQTILQTLLQPKQPKLNPVQVQREVRDRFFEVQQPQWEKDRWQELQQWAGRVFTESLSVGFHHYSHGELTFEQAKSFCASNILQNLLVLSESTRVTAAELQGLDKWVRGELMDYLLKKYPLAESNEVSKALQGSVVEVDNMGLLSNNYFATSDIVFELREDGNYNDLIMRMLNDLLARLDQPLPDPAPTHPAPSTHYTQFKAFATQLFESIEEEEEGETVTETEDILPQMVDFLTDKRSRQKMSSREGNYQLQRAFMKDSSKLRTQRQKYRQSVREYSHFLIGRKVSAANTNLFTQREIASRNMKIRSPSILRMLTKWCEQLRSKFTTPDYYSQHCDNIKVQRGSNVNSLLFSMRRLLDLELRREEGRIGEWLAQTAVSNYSMQIGLLGKVGRKGRGGWGLEAERATGRYAVEAINNLHSHLLGYLNRLIHGLCTVAANFYEKSGVKGSASWPSPPNLLTFSLGDLMRCKLSSRQREILRVFSQLKQISNKLPQKLKILRIKNRLHLSTNDILINVKFNNAVIAEVQLAVNSQGKRQTETMSDFNHFLYELQRAPFGCFAELANTWAYLDRRAEVERRLMEEEAEKQQLKVRHACEGPRVSFEQPFVCVSCEVAYYHNNYLRSHLQCQRCQQVVCAKCQLREQMTPPLRDSLIPNRTLRGDCHQMVTRIEASVEIVEELPQFGVCLYVESRFPEPEIFRLVSHDGQRYVLGRRGGKIYEIEKIQTPSQLASFLRRYVVFQLDNRDDRHIKLEVEEAIERYILPRRLQEEYRRERESVMVGHQLSDALCRGVLGQGSSQSKLKVRKLFLDSNQITHIDYITQQFRNLNLLELSCNPIQSLANISALGQLRSLSLVGCGLRELPEVLFEVVSLEELCLGGNGVEQLRGVERLVNLKILDVSRNGLRELPAGVGRCEEMVVLRCEGNRIAVLPGEMGGLRKLRALYMGGNCLEVLPDQLAALGSLESLDLSRNELRELPSCLGNLSSLIYLDLSFNRLTGLPDNFGQLYSLSELNLDGNGGLSTLPADMTQLKSLEVVRLGGCGLEQVPLGLCEIVELRELYLSGNQLTSIREEFRELVNLEVVDLSNNQLKTGITALFQKMIKLREIRLANNQLASFPSFFNCEKIRLIDFSHNLLASLSAGEVAGLDSLQVLDLSYNQLESITQGLSAATKLKELNLANNRLRRVETDCHEGQILWPNLIRINLAENELTEVPSCLLRGDTLGNLQNLAAIDLRANRVEHLPSELSKLKKLKQLQCASNNVRSLMNELHVHLKERRVDFDLRDKLIEEASPTKRRTVYSRNKDMRGRERDRP